MTIAVLRKVEPASDGFFDLHGEEERRGLAPSSRTLQVLARAAATADRASALLPSADPGVYIVSRQEAKALNAVLELPEQPVYDWDGVFEEDE